MWRRRVAIVSGLLALLSVIATAGLALRNGVDVGGSRTTFSDLGILLTLLVAVPAALWVAVRHWNRR